MKHHFTINKLVLFLVIGLLIISCLSYGGDKTQRLRSIQAPPEFFVPSDLFPCNGKYESVPGSLISWPMGIALRNMGERDFSQFDSLPALGGGWKTYIFNSKCDFDVSIDAGITWNYGTANAFNSIRLNHVADTGATRYFNAEILALNISGGSLPVGIMLRESPTLASTGLVRVTSVDGGYMIDSFFDIWLELSVDGGTSWFLASGPLTIVFSYYPAETFFTTNHFPPATAVYVSQTGETITFPSGAMVRNIVKRRPTAGIIPPPPGSPVIHSYNDEFTFQLSLDMGNTWTDEFVFCANTTQLAFTVADLPATFYAAEHLSLNISEGTLPAGVMLRESPTIASTGQYTTRINLLGYMISSFFDVFFEISFDGGMTWSRADMPIMLELYDCPTITIEPTALPAGQIGKEYSKKLVASGGTSPYAYTVESGKLPPGIMLTSDGDLSGVATDFGFYTFTVCVYDQNLCQGRQTYTMTIYSHEYFCGSDVFPPYGRYVNKPGDIIQYPMGIEIRNIKHRTMRPFDKTPDLGSQQSYTFNGFLSFELSLDQGATWNYFETKTANTINLDHTADSASESFFDLEVLQMDISGGTLPLGIMIRESPTQASFGRLTKHAALLPGGEWKIDSFFDITYEISLDGGASWTPAINNIYMELNHLPAAIADTDNFPPEAYESDKDKIIYCQNGVAIRHMRHYDLGPQGSPPRFGETKSFIYTGLVEFELSFNNGITWMHMLASATNSSALIHFADDKNMNFYDTEMLQFDIVGGTLPPGVFLRESPIQASVGEFNALNNSSDSWWVDSFFDVFFDVTLDGGMTWFTATEPLELVLRKSSVDIDVSANWNMISLPVLVEDPRKVVQFVNAISPAFAFEGTYVEKETLSYGVGYWLKYGESETVSISGRIIFEDTIEVMEGWNMIGSIGFPVDVSDIGSVPGGIVTSEFFEYTTAYNSTDTIHPGKGYWVKVSDVGALILSVNGAGKSASQKISIVPISELPPGPPDNDGSTRLHVSIPDKAALYQNNPNPFNPSTIIKYDLTENTRVTLKVYNIFGQEVATLVDGWQDAGHKSIELNKLELASGIYFYRIIAGNFTDTKKMILCK